MRGFQFKFDTLLRYRERQKDIQEVCLAQAQLDVIRAESRLEQVRDERQKSIGNVTELQRNGADPAEIKEYYDYLNHLGRNEKDAASQLCEKITSHEKVRLELIEASKREKVVSKLKENQLQDFKQEITKSDAKALDEIAIAQFRRRGGPLGSGEDEKP